MAYLYGPMAAYIATEATPLPRIDVVPPSPWAKFTSNERADYSESGITITTSYSENAIYALGSVHPQDYRRTQQTTVISLPIMAAEVDFLAKLFAFQTATTVSASSGTPGTQTIEFGLPEPNGNASYKPRRALLLRGTNSPSGAAFNTQLWVPSAILSSSETAMTMTKGEPVTITVEFMAMQTAAGLVAKWQQQTAAAT